jgi:hypothetical protein
MSGRSTFVSSSFSFSSSSNNSNGQSTGQASVKQTFTDADGNKTVKTSRQTLGQPAVEETRRYDSRGQALEDSNSGNRRVEDANSGNRRVEDANSGNRRVEDVSNEQAKNDRLYEERIEDE